MRRPRRPRGFTLIELMVTLAIAAILMFLAIPSFVSYQKNTQLTSAANSLLAAINAARGEAMKRGMNAMVVESTGNGSDWTQGWVVFVDKNNDREYINTDDITVLTQTKVPSGISITGTGIAAETPAYIMFDASGYSKKKNGFAGNLTISFVREGVAAADGYRQTRKIKIASTGRIRMCTPKSASDEDC